ncbi:hypothetical protein [Mastigocoleus sp. MO_188.B34]|uniref:hypothetical protein n=1 Tax=Mastigocoleus sp. MO_188.B34 TaxID=3036635 RepID=UPI0026315466|nr:hypothetical protein [Mastigocoleus sp. MO_188.B34]MDJ0697078.1 hypothetical protein [Mastigocoleus sp. MO_188.B34]
MMIFILACGYLFTVYLLLALAKRSQREAAMSGFPTASEDEAEQNVSLTSEALK